MKVLIYLFGVIPIWIGLGVLIGRLLRTRFGVDPFQARLWGFVVSPILMIVAVVLFAAVYNDL